MKRWTPQYIYNLDEEAPDCVKDTVEFFWSWGKILIAAILLIFLLAVYTIFAYDD